MTSSLENLGNAFGGKLPLLDAKNWDRWSKQMKVIFGFQEVQEVVETAIAHWKRMQQMLNNKHTEH
ncbi:hypothetical protein A2U01_0064495 [Trifolium medium]|uniref:Uncharacterized protein n=1 Tax=Trifolium medium TaxID=97028 RepID=A0A392S331_9FABA|nr:hypothetical protein [Trifolium medium]